MSLLPVPSCHSCLFLSWMRVLFVLRQKYWHWLYYKFAYFQYGAPGVVQNIPMDPTVLLICWITEAVWKMSCYEFGLCTCFGDNEEPSYDSSKMWAFFSEHWRFYSAFLYATSASKYAVIGLFYLFEMVTFLMEVHMLIVKLHHSSWFLCNLRKIPC